MLVFFILSHWSRFKFKNQYTQDKLKLGYAGEATDTIIFSVEEMSM